VGFVGFVTFFSGEGGFLHVDSDVSVFGGELSDFFFKGGFLLSEEFEGVFDFSDLGFGVSDGRFESLDFS
jgi:hypothetical protein